MKHIFITMIVAAAFALAACEKEHDKGYYDNVQRIYFEVDSLNHSLGIADPTVEVHYFDFPVRKIGLPSDHEMKFKVTVLNELTNAEAGRDYETLKQEYVMPAGEMETVIPIGMYKNNLREDEYVYQLTFKLEPTDDFELGAKELTTATFTFNNFLEKPVWWDNIFNLYVVTYRPTMLAILVEEMGVQILDYTASGAIDYINQFRLVMKLKIYDYAVANPEHAEQMGWEFLDDAPWTYV